MFLNPLAFVDVLGCLQASSINAVHLETVWQFPVIFALGLCALQPRKHADQVLTYCFPMLVGRKTL